MEVKDKLEVNIVINHREYSYVGPKALQESLPLTSNRVCVTSSDDVLQWIKTSEQILDRDRSVVATFIIDMDVKLWIADRRSEHVLCAGKNVLSAGEITFTIHSNFIEVSEITNQSTGYCPEPESWIAVETALITVGLNHPSEFTTAYLFRRCDSCGTTNIVKDDWFECGVCQAPLSRIWNYDNPHQLRTSD
jgi:hypothetical protein